MSLALFFGTPAWGHTNPSLPLVAELVQRGGQIVYYSLEEFQPAIEQTGATFRSYGNVFSFDYTRWDENGFLVVRQLLQATECILDQFLKQIEEACLSLYYTWRHEQRQRGSVLWNTSAGYPQATDQYYVAKRVEQSGAGLQLDRKKVTSALLSLTATKILNASRFAQASKKIGESLRQAGGYMRAADEVQLFKQRYALI
ncbi:MAG: hypothetical protein M3Y39_02965 [Chloroflexota bacterium]|nr:hypothetical protein [Chloroflexota bacterium]